MCGDPMSLPAFVPLALMFDPAPRIAEVEGAVPGILGFALVVVGALVVIGLGFFLLAQFWRGHS